MTIVWLHKISAFQASTTGVAETGGFHLVKVTLQ
jgi:hypothetical protein